MKQKLYIFGIVTALIIFIGTIFKIEHFPGASILLTLGVATLVLLFIPLALIDNYKAQEPKQNLLLYVITFITCFVVFTGMLFKIQHWPFAEIILLVALPFPYVVFLPVFLITTSKIKNFNIYNAVAVLSLLAVSSVISALLALNVKKVTIEDSYNLSRNYTKIEVAYNQISDSRTKTVIDLKIDEVCKIVNECQDLILKSEGLSREQWKKNPGNLRRPEERAVASQALIYEDGVTAGGRLETGLKSLISLIENTKGYEQLAKAAPAIFDLTDQADSETSWGERIFRDNTLSWALIYLDGLEANLILLKKQI
jgi:hypothetical protein